MIGQENFIPGERYEAIVPDTLDLAERAEYAINAMTGALNEEHDYEYFWLTFYAPPWKDGVPGVEGNSLVRHHGLEWFDSNGRAAETLLMMRLVTGSSYNLDKENKMLESLLSRVGEDGLLYNAPYTEDTPWRIGGDEGCRIKKWRTDEDVAANAGTGRILNYMIDRYLKGGDAESYAMAQKIANKLAEVAIYKDDYAYYPATSECGADFAYFRESGWADTNEATSDMDSPEGAVTCYIGAFLHPLSRWYAVSKDEKILDLNKRLVNYMLKPQFWAGNVESWMQGMDATVFKYHGGLQRKPAALFKGHISGLAYAFQGLIEHAVVTNDAYVKEFVRQGYEYMRNLGIARIGMWGENIANNIMAAVAIKLSDSGVGDYWEDVDQYTRNTVVEDQFIDAELLKEERRKRGYPVEGMKYPVERFLGNLRWCGLIDDRGAIDPTQNGIMSAGPYLEPFYFIWESITSYKDGSAQINLLLNRASAWLDIDSYLPYEGKVVIKNKTAENISIRIPAWVDRSKISCTIDGTSRHFFWAGNYLMLVGLEGKESISIEFPMVETVETYFLIPWDVTVPWHSIIDELPKYILHMKGNTCIKVEFPNKDKFSKGWATVDCYGESGYPVYQREHYKQDKAPMKKTIRYVAPKLIDW